jgi:myosin protein heavy chain
MKGDFAVKHYAGEVVYSIEGWLFKNRDPLNDNVVALLRESTNPFMKTLWSASQHVVHASARQRGALRTVAGVYMTQLKELMDTLNNTTPNFVRCIKPNHLKKPSESINPRPFIHLPCIVSSVWV